MKGNYNHFEDLDVESLVKYFPEVFDAFSNTADGKYVYINNIEKDYSVWSQEAVDYFGLPSAEMYGAADIWLEHIIPEDRDKYMTNIDDLFAGRTDIHDMYYRARNKAGEYVTCSCKGILVRDDEGKPKYFAGTIINHELEDSIDPVTGLYTHQNLHRMLSAFSRENKAYILLYFGIQKFSNMNSTYGYEMGNRILKSMSDVMMERRGLGSLFRVEGTKFAYLIEKEYATAESLIRKFHELQDFVKNKLSIDGVKISMDICGSIIEIDDPSIEINTVCNSVLFALDKAKKENNRDIITVDDEFFEGNRKHLEVLADVRNAIKDNYKGFYLVYQPVVDAKSEKILGAEALLRWRDKDGKTVPPIEYIDWLEKDSLFFELGNWILRRAMEEMLPVVRLYPDFAISVNLAYPQLQRSDFNTRLVSLMEELQFPAKNLKLELTERCRLLDMGQLQNSVAFFKSLGINTAIDDFGTGYSALRLLMDLPVSQIKIDKSFVDGLENSREKQALLKAVTTCAKDLKEQVCVEGIETKEVAEFLRDNYYVNYFQGYYYAKPLETEVFLSEFKEGRWSPL